MELPSNLPPSPIRLPSSLHSKRSSAPKVLARAAHQHLEVSRLNNILHPNIPQPQILHVQRNLDCNSLPGLNNHLLEPLELDIRHHDAGDQILNVDLHDLRAVAGGLVGYVHGDSDGVLSAHLRLRELDRAVLESGVGLAVTEFVEREWVVENVLVAELEGAVLIFLADIDGAAGVEVIVVDRGSSDIVWEADGELSRWVLIAEEDVSEGVSALFRGVELLDKRRRLLRDPGLGNGLSGGENDDGWLAGVNDGLDEVGHGADEVEVRDVDVLTSGGVEPLPELVLVAGPSADDYDSDIGGGGGGDSVGETGLVRGPALAALGEGGGWDVLGKELIVEGGGSGGERVLTSFAGGFDAVVGGDSGEVAAVYDVVAVLQIISMAL